MTNEELVARIQNGEEVRASMEQLYTQNWKWMWKLVQPYRGYADPEDLIQEGYFTLYRAVQLYRPDMGVTFLVYLTPALQRRYRRYCNAQGCFDDPIRSLDEELPDSDGLTLGDTIADEHDHYEDVEQRDYSESLGEILWPMVAELPEDQAGIIRSRYREEKPLTEIAEEKGLTYSKVYKFCTKGLRELRKTKYKKRLEEYLEAREKSYTVAWKGTYTAFEHSWTSATERAAILLEESERQLEEARKWLEEAKEDAEDDRCNDNQARHGKRHRGQNEARARPIMLPASEITENNTNGISL